MAIETVEDLFHHTLRDMLYAEKKLVRALPKLAKATSTEALGKAFLKHAEETKGQVERLERVFAMIGKTARGKQCPAMDGLVEEGDEIVEETEKGIIRDTGLTAGAQAVEHYEIARYRALIKLATQMGQREASSLLKETLKEEIATDELLEALSGKMEGPITAIESSAKGRASSGRSR